MFSALLLLSLFNTLPSKMSLSNVKELILHRGGLKIQNVMSSCSDFMHGFGHALCHDFVHKNFVIYSKKEEHWPTMLHPCCLYAPCMIPPPHYVSLAFTSPVEDQKNQRVVISVYNSISRCRFFVKDSEKRFMPPMPHSDPQTR